MQNTNKNTTTTKNAPMFNVVAMRPAIIEARNRGNRAAINVKLCDELGISSVHFDLYVSNVVVLHKAACEYMRVINSPISTDKAREDAIKPVYTAWKTLLACGEKSKDKKILHVNPSDIGNIVAHVSKFMNDSANIDFSKEFCAKKVWATKPFMQFRKNVEIDIGIRIAQAEVMTDEQRELIQFQTRKVSKISQVEEKIAKDKKQLEELKKQVAAAKGKEIKAYLNGQIKTLETTIESCKESVIKLNKELLAGPQPKEKEADKPINTIEIPAEEPKAKAKTKAEPKTKKATKTEKVKAEPKSAKSAKAEKTAKTEKAAKGKKGNAA